ncbi:MAG TPA: AI-2E family transporter [Alphaproteobacteria bacterium]|nr:AI-2E family transporter [Alphaproteobacteria bacterium]
MSPGLHLRFWLITLVVVCVLLYLLRGALLPFVAGMAIAYFLDPAADRLEKWGCSRTLATTIITLAFALVVIALLVLIVPVLSDQVSDLVKNLPSYADALKGALSRVIGVLQERLPPDQAANLRDTITQHIGDALKWLGGLVGSIWSGGVALAETLSLIFVTPVVTFYLLKDWDRMVARIDGWLPRDNAEVIREQMRLIDQRLAGFVRGQSLVCLSLGCFYAVALSLAGLKFGLVVGLVAGILSFIPYVGTIVGFVSSVGLALAQSDNWQYHLLIVGIFVVGQVMEGNFLSPKLVGDRVGLHPVWIIFALFAGAALLGFLGVLLAVPVAAMIGVLGRFALQRYLASPLYSGAGSAAPPPPPRLARKEKAER